MSKKIFVAVIIILTSFFACKNQPENNEIKIGVIMALTGPVAEPGKNALRGIKLAVENHNKTSETKIKLIIEDSKSSPKDGVSAMNKLASSGVEVVIGDIMSSVFLACAPIAEQNKIVFFSPGASAPEVRNAGDYIFRNYLSDDFDGKIMAQYIFEKGDRKVGVISVNNDYGIGVSKTFKESYQGELLFHEEYPQGQTDFRTLISKIKTKEADALYLICNPSESGQLVRQLKEYNFQPTLYGNLTFENNEFIEVAKGSFDTITFSAPYFNLESDSEVTANFNSGYTDMFGSKPDVAAALGYDVALILSDLIQKGNTSSESIKNALYQVKDFEAVTGTTTFDNKGDVMKDIQLKEIHGDGKIELIKLYRIN